MERLVICLYHSACQKNARSDGCIDFTAKISNIQIRKHYLMKPIVLIQPGQDNKTVVITPAAQDAHTEDSWHVLAQAIVETCIEVINGGARLSNERIISLVAEHPEWRCTAVEGRSIATWMLVE